jgi:hypothetical protein
MSANYLRAVMRSREMLRVLHQNHLILENEPDETTAQHALALLALSAFYGKQSFSQVIKLFCLIWHVWEDNVDPEDLTDDRATALHTLLQDWNPPTGRKPS